MAEDTGISWARSTFNPWRGCVKVSPGCAQCYAERQSRRNPAVLGMWGADGTRVLAAPAQWGGAYRWHEQYETDRANGDAESTYRVFCASLADVFEDWRGQMTNSARALLWKAKVNYSEPWRPSVVASAANRGGLDPFTLNDARACLWELIKATPSLSWLLLTKRPENIKHMLPPGAWPNIWLGTSVENAAYLPRADALLEATEHVQVPVRFISYEPALGPVDFTPVLGPQGINWLIVGGESGATARPFYPAWAQECFDQCHAQHAACWFKQTGSNCSLGLPGKGDDPQRWPSWLRRQTIPNVQVAS